MAENNDQQPQRPHGQPGYEEKSAWQVIQQGADVLEKTGVGVGGIAAAWKVFGPGGGEDAGASPHTDQGQTPPPGQQPPQEGS